MAPASARDNAAAGSGEENSACRRAKVDPNSGRVVEEIIARVNNEIITRSEYEKARATAAEDAKQDCQNHCTPEQLEIAIEDRQKNALRDLIDQSLLVQRGKDMGISVEPDDHQEAGSNPHPEQFIQHGRFGEGGVEPGTELGGFQE